MFDNSKVSDHFAIIPTLQTPTNLSEPEASLRHGGQALHRRVLPGGRIPLVTSRVTEVAGHRFQTNGKVLVNPGWLAVYGKEPGR